MKTYCSQEISRGDIYYADLRPVIGSEQGGIRPVLILQNNVGNRHSPTVIVAAITGQRHKPRLPTHVSLNSSVPGLYRDSIILLEQLRTLDKSRLMDKVGSLGKAQMLKIDHALEVSVGLLSSYNTVRVCPVFWTTYTHEDRPNDRLPGPFIGSGERPPITGGCFMTKTELRDNLVFLSALKLLGQLTEKGLLTMEEAEKSRTELERKLRPTLLFA